VIKLEEERVLVFSKMMMDIWQDVLCVCVCVCVDLRVLVFGKMMMDIWQDVFASMYSNVLLYEYHMHVVFA